jgi:hypothetical protein
MVHRGDTRESTIQESPGRSDHFECRHKSSNMHPDPDPLAEVKVANSKSSGNRRRMGERRYGSMPVDPTAFKIEL